METWTARSRPTHRQTTILVFIARYVRAHGYPPSFRDIGRAFGISSSSTVAQHLTALERKGFLTHIPQTPRTLALTDAGRVLAEQTQGNFTEDLAHRLG